MSGRDVRETIELRETVRALLLAHNGGPASASERATFRRYAERTVLITHLEAGGEVRLAPGQGGIGAARAQILAAIAQASIEGTWPRLKACRSDVCRWAFYDQSKNRSSRWCTMEVCGARDKMRRYRRARSSRA